MLKSDRFNSIAIIFALNLFIAADLPANWKKNNNESSFQKQKTSYQTESADTKGDSLPPGVTRDWLNSLYDQNGNRIIQNSDPGTDREIPDDPDYFMNEVMPNVSMTGVAIGTHLGFSVSTAGDVNNDGYSDVIVGAPGYSSLCCYEPGRAYIFFGGPSMNNVADVTMIGDTINTDYDQFGVSVSSAGEGSQESYSVFREGPRGSAGLGRAYVFFGGAGMNNVADVTMTGESNSFGVSVSSAGDVNGDGYSDVIVGNDGYATLTGRAYIYFGGAAMNNTADVTMTGEAQINHFGVSVSSAGDVNGDGFSDVIVGANWYSSYIGKAYIFFGGASMNNVADVTMTVDSTALFGTSVSSAGDVNGDGYSDVIVGGRDWYTYLGRTFIFFGGASMNNTADVTMTGESVTGGLPTEFRSSVSSAGDVNGDGFSDLIVGDSKYSLNGINLSGKASIYISFDIKTVFLGMLIQGFYSPGGSLDGGPSGTMVQDTVVLSLRSSSPPYNIIESRSKIINQEGQGTFSFRNVSTGTPYYLQVRHRNSIETWSAGTITFSGNSIVYEFFTSPSLAYGNNMILVDNQPQNFYAVYSGDVNQNGVIDLTDVLQTYNDANSFVSGYVVTDINGDNVVDLNDVLIAYNNSVAFVAVAKP